MSARNAFTQAWWNRRKALVAAASVLVVTLAVTAFLTHTTPASEQYGLQTVDIAMGADTTVYSMTTAGVTKDANGRVTETRVDLDPTESASDLPVRVQTAWWHDGQAGTDLSELTGRAGRFVLQVTVHDLTAEATELGFETDGVHYREQVLVGVPLTVVASAQVSASDRVVQLAGDEDRRVTNGVLTESADAGRSVQWAAFLAPPMLSPTADFTLVLDTQDFEVPDFDITVQPGLVTDPSVSALVDRAYGADGYSAQLELSTITLVQNVTGQLSAALDFVDDVHAALEQDVAQLGEQTYRELESSSRSVLDHLEATSTELASILRDAENGIGEVGTATHSGVQTLARSLEDLLGSSTARPRLDVGAVDGCSVQMPTLAEGQARTVSATVHLADAQLATIADLFASGPGAPSRTCRDALHELLLSTIGDPSALTDPAATAACRSTPPDQRTVACTLAVARSTLQTDFATLQLADGDVRGYADQLDVAELVGELAGPDGLAATLTELREEVSAARSGSTDLVVDLADRAGTISGTADRARQSVALLRTQVAAIDAAVGGLQVARDVLHDSLFSGSDGVTGRLTAISAAAAGTATVGEWFAGSGYAAGLTDLVGTLNASGSGDVCVVGWADGLSARSSADEIVAALTALDSTRCPARSLAAASRDMVTGYAATVTAATAMGEQANSATTTMQDLATGFVELDASISALRDLTTATGRLATGLAALDDPTTGTGTLAEVAAAAQDLAALAGAEGTLGTLDAELGDLVAVVDTIWPDDSVQPVTGTAACAAEQPSADRHPAPGGQSVVWLSNRLLCLEHGLDDRLTGLSAQIDGAATSTDTQLRLTSDRTQGAADHAGEQVDLLSGELVAAVTAQRQEATARSSAMIEASRAQLRAGLDEILSGYDLASSQVLTQMGTSMQRSATRSTEVATMLSEDFADLLVNLGTPDPAGRGGMLGKLYGITTQVSETGHVLDGAGSTTTSYGNLRAGELRDINLRAAQFAAAEERLAGYRPFPQVDGDLETVFVFQLRAGR